MIYDIIVYLSLCRNFGTPGMNRVKAKFLDLGLRGLKILILFYQSSLSKIKATKVASIANSTEEITVVTLPDDESIDINDI